MVFCLKTSTDRKISVPHFLPQDWSEPIIQLRMFLNCAWWSCRYTCESPSCWHPVCNSLGESSPPKATEMWPWSRSCFWETTLLHSYQSWKSPATPGSPAITWDTTANLAYSSLQGCVLDCRRAQGARSTNTFSHKLPTEVCLSRQLHILDRNSCASNNQSSMFTSYTDERCFEWKAVLSEG